MGNQNCANCAKIQGKVKISRNGGEDIVKWPKPSSRCHCGESKNRIIFASKYHGVKHLDLVCKEWMAKVD